MTVTKGRTKYTFPAPNTTGSDSEALDLGSAATSDTESLQNEQPSTSSRPLRNYFVNELLTLKKHSGRRRQRRHQNWSILQALNEEDEDDQDPAAVMESYQSPFAKLLDNQQALEFWNIFIDKPELEQAQIIEEASYRLHSFEDQPKEKPLHRISSRIRRTFKVKKNLSLELVRQSEQDLITFFQISPRKIYERFPPNYFERLLLHAIAQYHNLKSLGLIENGMKKVEVFNSVEQWMPVERCLSDLVAQLRS